MFYSIKYRLFIIAAFCLLAEACIAAELSDNQLWPSRAVYKGISGKIILRTGPQSKWGENAGSHHLTRYDAGAEYAGNESCAPALALKEF